MAGRFFCSHFLRTITPPAVAILGPSRRYEGIITASCSMGSVTVFNQCNEAPCNDTQRCGTGWGKLNQVKVWDFRYQLMSGELVVWQEPRAVPEKQFGTSLASKIYSRCLYRVPSLKPTPRPWKWMGWLEDNAFPCGYACCFEKMLAETIC